MITVVNKRTHNSSTNDIYIGRGSDLGNNFSHLQGTKAAYVVGSRQQAIEAFKKDLLSKIEKGDIKVLMALERIVLAAQRGPVNLVCYCKPYACHGDVIKDLVEQRLCIK